MTIKKPLDKIGLKRGDTAFIIIDGDQILISKNDISAGFRRNLIKEEKWNAFLSIVVKKHGLGLSDKTISQYLDEAISDFIKKKESWWKQPAFTIGQSG